MRQRRAQETHGSEGCPTGPPRARPRWFSLIATLALALAVLPLPAHAAIPPVLSRPPAHVTATGLPTAQIDGVVWTQVIIGNTVYAGGKFTAARPAGAAAGTNTVPRTNLLAYDLRTGVLDDTFAPQLNGEVRTLAASADGTTLYVGGEFTTVGGELRSRFASFDVATGGLTPVVVNLNARLNAITVIDNSVYLGGWFSAVGTKTRSRLAMISGRTGWVSSWAPKANEGVNALVPTPDRKKIVVGGIFSKLNSTRARGQGAVDAKSGKSRTWRINDTVLDYGDKSGIVSLAADATTVYGSGFAFGGGNFEGTFAARPSDGAIKWLADCHGDTYDVEPIGDVVYTVGHAHHCANIGGFPDTEPRVRYQYALSFSTSVQGTVATNGQAGPHYGNFGGRPAPALHGWWPELTPGTFTGTSQAAWSVAANTDFVVVAGEFVRVNGAMQQGLTRFPRPGVAPSLQGPVARGQDWRLEATAVDPMTVDLAFRANWDRDDRALTYSVLRDTGLVGSFDADSSFWDLPALTYRVGQLQPGRTYSFLIRATDADQHVVDGTAVSVTTPLVSGAAPGTVPGAAPDRPAAPASAGSR